MKNIIINKFYFGLLMLSTLISSCSDYLELKPEIQKVITESFTSIDDIEASLTGAYSILAARNLYGEQYPASDYGTDEGYHALSWTASEPWIRLNNHNAETNSVRAFWVAFYQVVNQCNTVIARLEKSDLELSNTKMNEYIAEAKFLRAFSYLQLTVLFNEIPLRLTPFDTSVSGSLAASELGVVYDQIIEDFEFASENLLHVTDTDYQPGRANKMAAHGLMARTYLKMAGAPYNHLEYYQNAMDQCEIVMNDTYYDVVTAPSNKGYNKLFKGYIGDVYNLKESLFEISYSNLINNGVFVNGRHGIFNGLKFEADKAATEHRINVPYSQPTVAPSPIMDEVYEEIDERRNWNIPGFSAWNGKTSKNIATPLTGGFTIGKFRRWEPLFTDDVVLSNATAPYYNLLEDIDVPNANSTGVNFPILRYSDVLLMYAEASNEVNMAPTTEGIAALNKVRQRAGLDLIAISNPDAISGHDAFLSEIQDERLRELCFEGLRKFDLVRWNIYEERLNKLRESILFHQNYNASSGTHNVYLRCVENFDPLKNLSLPYPKQEVDLNNLLDQKPEW